MTKRDINLPSLCSKHPLNETEENKIYHFKDYTIIHHPN